MCDCLSILQWIPDFKLRFYPWFVGLYSMFNAEAQLAPKAKSVEAQHEVQYSRLAKAPYV